MACRRRTAVLFAAAALLAFVAIVKFLVESGELSPPSVFDLGLGGGEPTPSAAKGPGSAAQTPSHAPAAEDAKKTNQGSQGTANQPLQCPDGFDRLGNDCLYACKTTLPSRPVVHAARKGICLDDTTFEECSDRIPYRWPHTQERITSIRIFSPWKPKWPAWKREAAWNGLFKFVWANNARVLVGVEHTCNDDINNKEWEAAKQFLWRLGPQHVMGVAIGNEMELLHLKGNMYTSNECQERLWKHKGFWNAFVQRVEDLSRMPGFDRVMVTSVMGAFSLVGTKIPGQKKKTTPFIEKKYAMMNTFVKDVTRRFGRRYAFSFNFYPYFDPTFIPDAGKGGDKCWNLLHATHCLGIHCMVPNQAKSARLKAQQITGRPDDTLWIGETGWSYPKSSTMKTAMQTCTEWHSRRTFKLYYERFLNWDLSVDGVRPPDHVFYFTMRDSINFGMTEHFGLISSCHVPWCKLQISAGCHITTEGETCHSHVTWAKSKGIFEHPEWYPGLNPGSALEDFQEHLFRNGLGNCPEPC